MAVGVGSCQRGGEGSVFGMEFDFDEVVSRRGTGCIKFDRRPELDPFWVADMDFRSAPCILEALHGRVEHGVFGYPQAHEGVEKAILDYLYVRRGVEVPREQIVHLGGLVPALSLAVRAFCEPGEEVMTCTPVYPPFLGVHKDAGAKLLAVPHGWVNDRWEFDWAGMAKAVTNKTRVFLLCNPQNPTGRVFTREEIVQLAEFCRENGLVLVSDEIHCDLVHDEGRNKHVSALNLPERLRGNAIALLSPSKTWNIAGLGYAYAVIPDAGLRRRFTAARGHTLAEINALAYYAAEVAYRDGEEWRRSLMVYLRENRDVLVKFVNEQCEGLSVEVPEATYLAWIDARGLDLRNPAKFFEEEAGLFLSDGGAFGMPGWVRFNFGCSRGRMMEGLEKMRAALGKGRSGDERKRF